MIHSKALAEAMYSVYKAAGRGRRGSAAVRRAFKEDKFDMTDVSLKALAIECLGEQWYESLTPAGADSGLVVVRESGGGAVDSTGFTNLLATIIAGVMDTEPAEADSELADTLVTTRRVPRERGERRVNLLKVGREANRVVREGEAYSAYGFGEDWLDFPDTEKRGGYVLLTREMIAEDETSRALDAARTIISEARMNKSERIMLAVLGVNNSIFLPRSVAEATYTTATSGLDNNARVNLVTSGAELIDWVDIDEALQRWADMEDKVTGRPVSIRPARMQIIVMPAKGATAMQILNATQVESGTVTNLNGVRTAPNPAQNFAQLTVSPLAYHLLQRSASDPYLPGGGVSAGDAKNYWFMGDFAGAFEYLEQWPMTVETLSANSLLGFERDVVFGVKVSEKGVIAVKDPRLVQQMRQA